MTGQASPEAPRDSERRTNRWQFALFAISLTLFAIHVLIPVGALSFIGTAIAGTAGASRVLAELGALSPGIFEGTIYLASALLLLCAMLAGGVTAWNLLLKLGGRPGPPRLLLRRPWLLLGVFLWLASWLFIPAGMGRSQHPVLVGAFVLATALWTTLYVGYLLWSLGKGGLALSWHIARASPFGAGLLTLACLGSTALAFLVVAATKEAPTRQARLSVPRPEEPCRSTSLECSRQFLLASSVPDDAPWALSADTPSPSFTDCIESRYQDRALLDKAKRIAGRLVGSEDASDVVHGVLLSVCLQQRDHDNFEQFFLRSVHFGALKWRRGARTCSIDEESEPACDLRPDDQYVQLETQHVVQRVLCSLGEEHRQVLLMRYFDDMSELEIAQRLGIGYPAARKRVQRARDKFSDGFDQRCR